VASPQRPGALGERPGELQDLEGQQRHGPQAGRPAAGAGQAQEKEIRPPRSLHACGIGSFRPRL